MTNRDELFLRWIEQSDEQVKIGGGNERTALAGADDQAGQSRPLFEMLKMGRKLRQHAAREHIGPLRGIIERELGNVRLGKLKLNRRRGRHVGVVRDDWARHQSGAPTDFYAQHKAERTVRKPERRSPAGSSAHL